VDITKLFPVTQFYQGDDFSFNIYLPDYDSSLYSITYVFRKLNVDAFSITSTASLDGSFLMEVNATTTSDYIPGLYYVSAFLTETATGKKTTVGQTEIQIKADISQLTNYDPRSQNKIALEAVEAALASGAGSDVIEYTIGGTIVKKDRKGLLALRAFYLTRVRAEAGKRAIGYIYNNL
jgi:hypothetical protein